jgi:hypothetical protein
VLRQTSSTLCALVSLDRSRPRLTDISVRCHGFLDVIVREPSAKPNSLVSQV